MNILGVSCWYHDAAAALIRNGEIVALNQEERFSRIKHDFSFPSKAIDSCLEQGHLSKSDIDFVVFYDKPILKFERIISSILSTVPGSLAVFREAVPLWLSQKFKFHKTVKKNLGVRPDKVCFCYHHLAHAASGFFASAFDQSAILTVDGAGEWATATLGVGKGNTIKILKEMRFPHSLGLLYSVFTAFLGFKVNNGEYKVMGMASYGEPKYVDKIYKLVEVGDQGSIKLNMDYFSFHRSTSKAYTREFVKLFGEPRKPGSIFYTENTDFPVYFGQNQPDYQEQAVKNQYYADIAASIQKVLENTLIKIASYLKKETGMKNLCYAGGAALNSKANYELLERKVFEDIFIQPAATDAGGALGAALWLWCQVLGREKPKLLKNIYLGKSFPELEIIKSIENNNLQYKKNDDSELFEIIASRLSEGKVIGWFQAGAEWGPRALGNRSILADPRNPQMKNIVNMKIKFREPYRPFAPSILDEDIDEYIQREKEIHPDNYMLITYPVKKEKIRAIPAAIHVNGTARVQVVKKEMNLRFWRLIKTFKELTGVGAILNTSFNLKGQPIVNSPEDAVKTFLSSGIDMLVMGNWVIEKKIPNQIRE
jgi:carbamoyltransferase